MPTWCSSTKGGGGTRTSASISAAGSSCMRRPPAGRCARSRSTLRTGRSTCPKRAGFESGQLSRCKQAALQRPRYGSRFALRIGRFAGEIERLAERCLQRLSRPFAADRDVAVSPARIRIGLPVVSVDGHELPLPAKDRPQAMQRALHQLVALQAGQANGLRAACPADQEGGARRQRGPEGRKCCRRRMEEGDLGMLLLPEGGAKADRKSVV